MRALPWTSEFDGVSFGNSFGYLADDENADFLKAVARTLKPGARFILDAPAIAECLLPHFMEQRTIQLGDITATIDTRYDHEQSRMFPITLCKTELRISAQRHSAFTPGAGGAVARG